MYEQERDKSVLKVFCSNCNRYTSHTNGEEVVSFEVKPTYFEKSNFRCKICDSQPTVYNLQYALELGRESEGDMSAHPHFITPLFRYGETCLVRGGNGRAYAHCKIYGMRYTDTGNTKFQFGFKWEYYVMIHGKKELQWLKEEDLTRVKLKVF